MVREEEEEEEGEREREGQCMQIQTIMINKA